MRLYSRAPCVTCATTFRRSGVIALARTTRRRSGSVREQRRARLGRGECEEQLEHFRPRSRPQRLDDDRVGAGAVHDAARAGAVLRRPGAAKERAVGPGAMSRHCRAGHDSLVGGRLLLVFARGSPFIGGLQVRVSSRSRCPAERRLLLLGLAERLRDVPADVRDHHAGADHRRDRRANEVRGGPRVRRDLDVRRLLPARAHGLGHRRLDERRVEP